MLDSEQKAAKRAEIDRKLEKRHEDDMRRLLAMPEGRRTIWWLLSLAGVFRSSFTGNSHTFFNEGRRSIGLDLLKDVLDTKPESFAQMQQEHASEQKSLYKDIEKTEESENA